MSRHRRPNVLVQCSDISVVGVADEMAALCVDPPRVCLLPGSLHLPAKGSGTLMIGDVSTLTPDQQVALHNWLDRRDQRMQVVSITSVPLLPLVEDGRFLDALFYRLNVVHMTAEKPEDVGQGWHDVSRLASSCQLRHLDHAAAYGAIGSQS